MNCVPGAKSASDVYDGTDGRTDRPDFSFVDDVVVVVTDQQQTRVCAGAGLV